MMKKTRIAIFAHYDVDKIIDDYVIYYLKCLKEVTNKIIFVSANNLDIEEKVKLKDLCETVISENHNEYDFGSYKRGFLYYLDNKFDADEIIFANDSCYGPIYSLAKVFNEMEDKECDFWGITKNKFDIKCKPCPHIQSYFMVFKQNVFQSPEFIKFFMKVKPEDNKNDIIQKYEVGLSKTLFDCGFKSNSYVTEYSVYENVTIFAWRELLLKKLSPFIKCSIPRLKNFEVTTIEQWQSCFKNTDYKIILIENNLKRLKTRKIQKNVPYSIKLLYFSFYRKLSYFKFLGKIIRYLNPRFSKKFFD